MPFIFDTDRSPMNTLRDSTVSRSPFAMRRIVSAIAAGMLGLAASARRRTHWRKPVTFCRTKSGKGKTGESFARQSSPEITAYQIQRYGAHASELRTTYQGYLPSHKKPVIRATPGDAYVVAVADDPRRH